MKKAALLLASLLLCRALPARADAPPAPAAPAAEPAKPAEGAKPAGDADLSFDLLDEGKKEPKDEAKAAAEAKRILEIDRQSKTRRNLLVAHQAFGFATLAALAATVVIGHLNYYDKYQSGDFSLRYEKAHMGLGIGTTGLFATTGILALAAPNPYPKPIKLDTALIHKIAMAVATAGMAAQIIMGPIIETRSGRNDQAGLALGHVITGYATFAFMATGVVTYFF